MLKEYIKKIYITRLCFCVVIAYLLSLATELNFREIKYINETKHSQQIRTEFSEESFNVPETIGMFVKSKVIYSVNNYVGIIEVDVDQFIENQWYCKVYYSNDTDEFTEACSFGQFVSANAQKTVLEVNANVQDLRIDIITTEAVTANIEKVLINLDFSNYLIYIVSKLSFVKVVILFFFFYGIFLFFECRSKITPFVFKYRWLIGCVIIIIATCLKLNGSSIGYLFNYGLPGIDDANIWGNPKAIRSDEYVVFTEMALSQAEEGFPYFSNVWGYSPKDMSIVFGQPILNLITLYRPFLLGYLFIGAEGGLSFYWVSRFIIGFLTSFEFGRLITRNNITLSVAYALMIILSPIVAWWYSVNSIVELLTFGQLAIVLFYNYIYAEKTKTKILYALGIVVCAGGYIITFYPRWMYPLSYVFLSALVAIIINNRQNIKITIKDIFIFIGGFLILFISVFYIFHTSEATINALNNTIYPGKTKSLGGDFSYFFELFRSWGSIFFTFLFEGNPCEKTSFFDFFPLGIIFSIIVIFIKKKKDTWLICLNTANIFLTIYVILGFPEWLSNITLLSSSSANRCLMAISLINLMILIRVISLNERPRISVLTAIALGVCIGKAANICFISFVNIGTEFILTLLSVCIVLIFVQKTKTRVVRTFFSVSIAMSLIGGAMVNPLNAGINCICHNPLATKIKTIDSEEKGLWAVCLGKTWVFNNLPATVGAKCVNATSVYPDIALWTDLGMADEENLWNRYIHMPITLTNEDSITYEMPSVDMVYINMPLTKLEELGVKYIISNDYITFSSDVQLLCNVFGYKIYKIEKNTEVSDEFYHLANLSDENWTNGVFQYDSSQILMNYSVLLCDELSKSHYIVCNGEQYKILHFWCDDKWINIQVDKEASSLSYPADLILEE